MPLTRFASPLLFLFAGVVFSGCPTDPEVIDWQPAFDADSSGWILSVWGAEGERYAVGGRRQEEGVIMHFDGSAWNEITSSIDFPLLNWVYGFSADDVFMVGNDGRSFHYDGEALSEIETPTEARLWGVWGATRDDLYAVGGNGRTDDVPVLLHYDGVAWSEVAYPELERANVRAFFKVWGSSANDVIVVGQRGVILRYDGSTWQEFGAGTGEDLISVWGTGPDRVVAVGSRTNGVIATWDGTEWRSGSLSPMPGLNGVWTGDGNTVHVVGVFGTVARIDFDTFAVEEDIVDVDNDFHAIFGDGESLTAVGGNLAAGLNAPTYNGTVFERTMISTDSL